MLKELKKNVDKVKKRMYEQAKIPIKRYKSKKGIKNSTAEQYNI